MQRRSNMEAVGTWHLYHRVGRWLRLSKTGQSQKRSIKHHHQPCRKDYDQRANYFVHKSTIAFVQPYSHARAGWCTELPRSHIHMHELPGSFTWLDSDVSSGDLSRRRESNVIDAGHFANGLSLIATEAHHSNLASSVGE